MTAPLFLSASEIAAKISAGDLTHRAVAEAYLERVDATDGPIKAYTYCDPQKVRDQADALDARAAGPLAGLPVGVKDVIATADMPTGYGSKAYEGQQPFWDAPCVTQTKAAGGMILGKTVTTEFAMASAGPTCNPWNLAHTPGGSSSGSCAAVAAGMALMAFGTQTAGSIIRPASYCGVVGYKPSFGLLEPAEVKVLAHSLDTLGMLTRSVCDAALIASILGGRPELALTETPESAPTVGLFRTPPFDLAEPATQAALEQAIAKIEAKGGKVIEIDVPASFASTHDLHAAVMGWEVTRALAHERLMHGQDLTPVTQDFLTEKAKVTAPEYDAAIKALPKVAADLAQAMEGVDVLMAPSAPGTAPEGFASTGAPAFNVPWTLLHMPALTLPTLVHGGLPVGVQILGRVGTDAATLRAAAWVEAALDGPKALEHLV
jgi:amidase